MVYTILRFLKEGTIVVEWALHCIGGVFFIVFLKIYFHPVVTLLEGKMRILNRGGRLNLH